MCDERFFRLFKVNFTMDTRFGVHIFPALPVRPLPILAQSHNAQPFAVDQRDVVL